MTDVIEEAKEIARQQGHKDVDHIIVCTDGERVPVWRFYLPAAEVVLAAVSSPGDRHTKSAPEVSASHRSGERDPSVTPDYPGADTVLSSMQRKLDASITEEQAREYVRKEQERNANRDKPIPQPDGFINDYD